MITNEELDWATDLPLTEAWKVVHQYNQLCQQLRTYPTLATVMARRNLEAKHPGICWLIDFRESHPLKDEIPLSEKVELDYNGHDTRRNFIERFLKQLKAQSTEVLKPTTTESTFNPKRNWMLEDSFWGRSQ